MNLFNSIPVKKPKRNNFNLSHTVRTSLQMGNLTPILCMPVLPRDTVTLSNDIVIRLAPQLAPVMADVDVYAHYFFVPWRIIWDDYADFMTGGKDGTLSPSFPRYRFPAGDYSSSLDGSPQKDALSDGGLCDYLGFPLPWSDLYRSVPTVPAPVDRRGVIGKTYEISALPLRAYQLIYSEYFRDQNLENEIDVPKTSGVTDFNLPAATPMFMMRRRAWAKDYFTSALPEPQRGPDVPLFDGTTADSLKIEYTPDGVTYVKNQDGHFLQNAQNLNTAATPLGTQLHAERTSSTSADNSFATLDNSENLRITAADDAQVSAPTMNDLRRRMSLQRFLEVSNRAGARLKEFIFGHFGAVIPDSTLQRPLYLGGGAQKILFTDVIQNSASVTDENTGFDKTSLGQTAGYGICTGRTAKVRHTFSEHGYIMCILSIRPRAEYFQGIDKHLQKFDRFDHAFPEFANLGEQEIQNKELFFAPYLGAADYDGTFGYTPRYAEYKFMNSRIHGTFRTSLNYWHLARMFSVPPALNDTFVHVSPDADNRIFAVETTDTEPVEHYYASVYHNIIVKRCLPKYGIPTFL